MDSWNKGRIAGVVAIIAMVALAVIPLSTISDLYDNIAAGEGLTDLIGPSLASAEGLTQEEIERMVAEMQAEQLEKDKAEAIARGISIETVVKERQAMLEEAEAAENMRIRANQLAGPGIIILAIATVTMLYMFRRKIVANFSPRWRGRSKEFRTWVFASVCWAIAVFFYVFLADPYAESFSNDEMTIDQIILHIFGMMIIPPLFFGGAWFGYKRFVE